MAKAPTRALNGANGNACRTRLYTSAALVDSSSARAAAMARAISASERPLSGAGTTATLPHGAGDFTRNVMRRAEPMANVSWGIRVPLLTWRGLFGSIVYRQLPPLCLVPYDNH